MKRISFLSLLMVFFSQVVLAQGKFQFERESHDFGRVVEGAVPTYEFRFKNVGTSPITLEYVKPSCGCTSPEWSKEPVMPGDEGVIVVKYNSQGRLGMFNKSITITSDAEEATKVITIKGVVEKPTPEDMYTKEELAKSPVIFIEKKEHFFGKIEKGKPVTYKVVVKNNGLDPLVIKDVKSACNCTTYKVDKESINKGKSATITVTYTPYATGQISETLYISSNDLRTPEDSVVIKAEIAGSLSQENILQNNKKTGF